MSTLERDLTLWADGDLPEADLLAAHGDEAGQLIALHNMLRSVESEELPTFNSFADRLAPRPVGLVDRLKMKAQRPIAVALGSVLMTGGAAYAAVPPVRDAINNAVQKVGEAMGIVESTPAGDLTDPDEVVPGDNSRLNEDPNFEGVGEQGMGRGEPGRRDSDNKGRGKGKGKDGKAISGERRKRQKGAEASAAASDNAAERADDSGAPDAPGASSADKNKPDVPEGNNGSDSRPEPPADPAGENGKPDDKALQLNS